MTNGNEPQSLEANPLFTDGSGLLNVDSDFSLNYLSPAIDAGTTTPGMTSTTTDYLGNPIYGAPDIGPYEYQPPYTMGVSGIDIGGGARVYGDGKFRTLTLASGNLASLTITPSSGSFPVYASTTWRPAWLDITNITNWTNSHKTWTESNAATSSMVTNHTIGNLDSNAYYTITVTNASSSNISGINGTPSNVVNGNAICESNSSGTLFFQYNGGYSTHTFDMSEDANDAALSALTVAVGTLSPTFDSSTTSYTDVLPHGTASAPAVTATTDDPNATDTITQASSPTGSATIFVTAEDNITTSTYSISFTVAPTPLSITSFSLAATSTSLTVPIVSLTTSGTVAEYLFSELPTTPSSTNSGWLNTIPASYTFLQAGSSRTLYAWVKDGSGNVSPPASATVSFPYYAIPATTALNNFVASGIVTSTGSSVASTTAITFSYPVQVSIGSVTVGIPANTFLSTASSSDFTTITATTSVATAGLPANSGIVATVQYGFASTSIALNQSVTITIPVDASYDGQTLSVYRSEDGGMSWTQITTCTVTGGICSFTTSNLSSFAVVVPTVVSTPSTPGVVVATGGGGSAYDIYIDNGVATATSSNVTLSLYGTGAYTMELSNSSSFSSSTWIPYVTTLPWTLASSTGAQTVYVQFRAVSGSIVGSAQASIDLTTASIPMPAVTSTTGMTVSQMESLLASLEAELHALEAHVPSQSGYLFTRNLSLWSTGNDVKQLETFLISENSGIAAAKLAEHGTTNVFGMLRRRVKIN